MSRLLLAVAFVICLGSAQAASEDIVLISDVKWQQLNPLRGDKSPKAGALWGKRTGPGPAGFLVKFVDGFSSPPHIHNVAYRGVVISGLIHNDDPKAEAMWMPKGSFWTQPAGGVHITAAKGKTNIAYIEVEDSFGVLPAKQAFASNEKPINVDVTNIVWLDPAGMKSPARGFKVAYLWGKPQAGHLNGTLIKLPAGFIGKVNNRGSKFRAVVIQGKLKLKGKLMDPGSTFGSKEKSVHSVSCKSGTNCILYTRMKGRYAVMPDQAGNVPTKTDIYKSLRFHWGQYAHKSPHQILTEDVTCDGEADKVLGFVNRDNPEGLFYSLVVAIKQNGKLSSESALFPMGTNQQIGLCKPLDKKPPELSVEKMTREEAMKLSGQKNACHNAIKIDDRSCDALRIFWVTDVKAKKRLAVFRR